MKAVVVLVVACCEDDVSVNRNGIMTRRSIADVFIRENIILQTVKTISRTNIFASTINIRRV